MESGGKSSPLCQQGLLIGARRASYFTLSLTPYIHLHSRVRMSMYVHLSILPTKPLFVVFDCMRIWCICNMPWKFMFPVVLLCIVPPSITIVCVFIFHILSSYGSSSRKYNYSFSRIYTIIYSGPLRGCQITTKSHQFI